MAEGETRIDHSDEKTNVSVNNMTSPHASRDLRACSTSPTSRAARWKLSRSSSKGWFNKSFDQAALSKNVPPHPKPMRRQSSVSDFFQSVLTKSRSHFIGLFSSNSKKGSTRNSMLDIPGPTWSSLEVNSSPKRRQFSENHTEIASSSFQHPPKPSVPSENTVCSNERVSSGSSSPSRVSQSDILNLKDKPTTKGRTSPAEMFIVTSNNEIQKKTSLIKSNSPLRRSSQSLNSQKEAKHISKTDFLSGSQTRGDFSRKPNQPHLSHSSSITFSFLDFTEHKSDESEDDIDRRDCKNYRQISSAPGGSGRQSLSTGVSFLKTGEDNGNTTKVVTKRALAKSNSDTITKFSSGLTPITKASSDGNCFRASQSQTQISASVAAKITDYLFVGSVEAAYSEPLLCKYKITSLIDMTNIQPRVVPLHKKSDCPCACLNKGHFRSKLNIGVDDIEWENLEQYFKEINTFIDGSIRKKGRTLIFSYMGHSRAPAAAMQHLMHRYGMSYREAFKMIVSKWPQTKINPGFIKTLKRLEVNLSQGNEKVPSPVLSTSPLQGRNASLEEGEGQDAKCQKDPGILPPVVRGAWLEC